ncbi:peptidoglycan editing factor PgeF [Nocardioides korecus]
MYSHRSTTGPVDLAFTDRHGGVGGVPATEPSPESGPGPVPGLDLAVDPDHAGASGRSHLAGATGVRRRNLELVVADFAPGATVVGMEQVHGDRVVTVTDPARAAAGLERCDALVTTLPDVALVVRVADCVPVLLVGAGPDETGSDEPGPDRGPGGVVGAVHAGRRGVELDAVTAAVERMRELGAGEVEAWVGPHVCGACYEVPPRMREQVAEREPSAASTTSWGTTALDLGAAVAAQLRRAGVPVHDVSRCTLESPDLFSYRRDGARAGRLAGLVRRRA